MIVTITVKVSFIDIYEMLEKLVQVTLMTLFIVEVDHVARVL